MTQAWSWLLLAALATSVVLWVRHARGDPRLLLVYAGAFAGAFAGAKLAYLLVEGVHDLQHADWPWRWLTGKSILGALPGGYLGVEAMKRLVRYAGTTGDWFASVVPLGTALGRIGCWLHGCCQGRVLWTAADGAPVRWPAPLVELLFNLAAALALLWLRCAGRLPGQHFHLYLMAYGLFRAGHELLRDTPPLWGPVSGYAVLTLLVAAFGLLRYRTRRLDADRQDAAKHGRRPEREQADEPGRTVRGEQPCDASRSR